LTNGRNHFAAGDNDPLTTTANAIEGDYPDFQDPEFIFLSKQKLLLENEHIQLQVCLFILNFSRPFIISYIQTNGSQLRPRDT
jgi:hypothetical protein